MTAKPKGYDAALTLRIPGELKERCSSEARKRNITTNEWIKQTLEKAVTTGFAEDLVSDEEVNIWYEQEFELPRKTGELEKPSREQFVKLAAKQFLGLYRCRKCGTLNTGNSKFCCGCGEEISWEHPDIDAVTMIMDEYAEKNPKKGSGFHYVLSIPSPYTRTGRFQIMERKEDKAGGYSVVKEISPEEIALYRKLLEIERRKEEDGE
ncbi:MAG: toxin-antitoxin system HicB family antitoxin [Methanocorpusculum sp.]|nr:toxin-antitoxin system HicB family antitoxin [Methanocorpusculum sp.]